MPPADSYDLEKLINKCAHHAWHESNATDLKKHGIKNEAELRQKIAQIVEHPDTKAFRCQPKMDPNFPTLGEQFGREVYVLTQFNRERNRMESLAVVLNPNTNQHGEIQKSTVWITEHNPLKRLITREFEKTGERPKEVTGGRAALCEQEAHRQLVVLPVQPERKVAAEPENPKRIEAAILVAYTRSSTPQDFAAALEKKGLQLAFVSKDEAEHSRGVAAVAKAQGRDAPVYREGEIVVLSEQGRIFKLNERTTGDKAAQIEKFLAPLDRSLLKSVNSTWQIMSDRMAALGKGTRTVFGIAASLAHGFADAFMSLFAPLTPRTPAQIAQLNKEIQEARSEARDAAIADAKYRYNDTHDTIKKSSNEQREQAQKAADDYYRKQNR